MPDTTTVYTIGHSTRSFPEFLALLQAHGIGHLVDVRAIPRSRRYPHFNTEALAAALPAAGVGYTHAAELGGRRRPRPDSPNRAWRNDQFRGYADHMQTPEFQAGLDRLLQRAGRERVVIMCAEAVHWRCHRSLIADALVARGAQVLHIQSAERAQPHTLAPHARVIETRVIYPGEELFDAGA